MIENFKELLREKFSPIHLWIGDSINFTYNDKDGKKTELIGDQVKKNVVINEAMIFEGTFEGRYTLGVMAIEEGKA